MTFVTPLPPLMAILLILSDNEAEYRMPSRSQVSLWSFSIFLSSSQGWRPYKSSCEGQSHVLATISKRFSWRGWIGLRKLFYTQFAERIKSGTYMTLGGRPKKDKGHRAKNLSLDLFTINVLTEVRLKNGNESEFVEKAVKELAGKLSFSCVVNAGK